MAECPVGQGEGRAWPGGRARTCLATILMAAAFGCGRQGPPLPPEESVKVPSSGTLAIDVEAPKRTASPVVRLFEGQSGIKVEARYLDLQKDDVVSVVQGDATAGRADLFWASTPLAAMELTRLGLAAPFRPAGARSVPTQYRDPQFRWIGFAANPRVIIYNSDLVKHEEAPTSIFDMTRPPWAGKGAMARIARGTPAYHAAALFALWGSDRGRTFFEDVARNGTRIVEDDAAVVRLVTAGTTLWGFVDLDRAIEANREAAPIHIFFPDRMSQGAIVCPQVAVLLRNAPHPDQARGLFAYFFATEAAWQLGQNDAALITFLPGIPKPDWVPSLGALNVTQVDSQAVYEAYHSNARFFASWGVPAGPPAPPPG